MKKLIALFAAISILSSAAALAGPPSKDKKPAKPPKKVVKAVDLWVCPITGENIKDHKDAGKGEVVSGKVVHFCCGGCPEKFKAMTAKEKQAKIAEAAKKVAPKGKS